MRNDDDTRRPKAKTYADDSAEAAVLGVMICNPACIPDLGEIAPVHFANPKHAVIAAAILELDRAGMAINHLSVSQALKDSGQLVAAGGPAYLMRLDETAVPLDSTESVVEQVDRLRDLALRRAARAFHLAQADALADFTKPAEELILASSGHLAGLGSSAVGGVKTAAALMETELESVWAAQDGKEDAVMYIPSGVRIYDELVGGYPRRFLTILAAQPGVGKSSFVATSALAIAERGETCAVFSLEDAGGWMPRRYLAQSATVAIRQLMTRGLTDTQQEKVQTSAKDLQPILQRIFIDDRRGLTVHRVVASARQMIARHGVRVIFIDHLLEMLDFGDPRSRDERIGEILRHLRDLAASADVAVVLCAHLKDPDDSRVDSRFIRPKLQDFAGGRFVDRMARVAVGFWFPPAPQEPKPPKLPPEPKPPAKADAEERERILQRWELEKTKLNREYEKKREQWRERCALAEDTLVATVVKASEGGSGFDFTMRRVRHAAMVSRTEGGKHDGETGFTKTAA